jgi:hypothetical protein
MKARQLFATLFLSLVGIVAITPTTTDARADSPAPFGPVASRSFQFKGGTTFEKPGAGCSFNADFLFLRGPGVANAKNIDVSPRMGNWDKQSLPTTDCVAPDCTGLLLKATDRDAVGTRTVTLKHADGRSITTTFDLIANAGRCDYPAK